MNSLDTLGAELRELRESLGVSRDEVYLKIRIPKAYVKALEEGDLAALPAPCYVVGFVKSYCAYLGAHPSRYVNAYREALRPVTASHRILPLSQRKGGQDATPRWVSEAITWAAICAIIVLGWMAYTLVVRPDDSGGQGRVEAETLRMVLPPAPGEELP